MPCWPGRATAGLGGRRDDPDWRNRPAGKSYAEATRPAPPTQGETIWTGKCAACHDDGGDAVGPPLGGVVARRGAEWLTRWLVAPEKLVAAGDPAAVELVARYQGVLMPSMDLSAEDAKTVEEWLGKATQAEPRPELQPKKQVTLLEP